MSVHACVNQDKKLGAPIQACSCAELLIVYTSSFAPACSPPLHLHKFSAGKLLVAFTLVQSTTILSNGLSSSLHLHESMTYVYLLDLLTALCDGVSGEELLGSRFVKIVHVLYSLIVSTKHPTYTNHTLSV